MTAATERRTAISLTPSSRPRLCLQPDRSARMLLDAAGGPGRPTRLRSCLG